MKDAGQFLCHFIFIYAVKKLSYAENLQRMWKLAGLKHLLLQTSKKGNNKIMQ